MLAGSLQIVEEKNYYTNDFRKFYKDVDMTHELSVEDAELWAVSLNSPWSQKDETWIVECNCVNAYFPMFKRDPVFRCCYEVVGCDMITSIVYGYGNTQQDALQECLEHFDFLQKEFNKADKSY